jgi:hypothetical protein
MKSHGSSEKKKEAKVGALSFITRWLEKLESRLNVLVVRNIFRSIYILTKSI